MTINSNRHHRIDYKVSFNSNIFVIIDRADDKFFSLVPHEKLNLDAK